MTVSNNYANLAYRDATKVAERILEATSSGQANSVSLSGDGMKPQFGEMLTDSLKSARDVGYKSESFSTGAIANNAELHDLITAVSSAELTLNTVVAVRDRVINAYQDIIKMPI